MSFGSHTGIYSIVLHYSGQPAYWEQAESHGCAVCRRAVQRSADLFIDDADSYLHRVCLGRFLESPLGITLLARGVNITVVDTAQIMTAHNSRVRQWQLVADRQLPQA